MGTVKIRKREKEEGGCDGREGGGRRPWSRAVLFFPRWRWTTGEADLHHGSDSPYESVTLRLGGSPYHIRPKPRLCVCVVVQLVRWIQSTNAR